MNGIIIYKTTYGTTKQYADWISEETGFPVVSADTVTKKEIGSCDTVIVGCPFIAFHPVLAKWIVKKWELFSGKRVVLYTTSGALPDDPSLQNGVKKSFPPDIFNEIRYFPLGGRIIMEKLNPAHKMMMRLGQKMVKDPRAREEMGKDKDNVDRNGIRAILDFINGKQGAYRGNS